MLALRRDLAVPALHVFTLCSLAIAEPIFDQLSRRAEFFVARGSSLSDVISLVLILCIFIPGILVLLEILAGAFAPTVRTGVHLLWIFLLLSLFGLLIVKQYTVLSGIVALSATLLPALLIAIVYQRFSTAKSFFSFLSPAVILIPTVFLFHPSVHKILQEQGTVSSYSKVNARTPIIMIVFDALPVISLMDEGRMIDPIRYPNFARLLEDATWFRNTSSVASLTNLAVPAILTGAYPKPAYLPTYGDYPRNLFTFLGGSYELKVFESATRLCPRSLNAARVEKEGFLYRMESLLADLSAVYLHLVLPSEFSDWLPSVTETWGNFWGGRGVGHGPHFGEDRSLLFANFLETLTPTEKPTLYYLHITLPHPPWKYLPSGREYTPHASATGKIKGTGKGAWADDEWAVQQGLQRYLLQLGYADTLLGQLMDRLKKIDLYERSLIVVTADHGVSFWPGAGTRKFREFNCLDLVFVPLFIKAPFQTEGSVIDRKLETIDILPTVADLLDVPLPWNVEGYSAFDPKHFKSRQRQFATKEGMMKNVDCDMADRSVTLEKKIAWFGSRTGIDRLFKIGPHAELIGMHVNDLNVLKTSDASVELKEAEAYQDVDPSSNLLPVHIAGWIRLQRSPDTRLNLGIAVNGVVRAVTRTYYSGERLERFAAMVPESSFRSGRNDLQIFVLQEQGNKLVLLPARL